MTYSEKLKHPKWQAKRLEVLKRDNFTCLGCESSENTLHVHHLYYVSGRDPWEYPMWSLKTLCEDCHSTSQEIAKTEFQSFEFLLEELTLSPEVIHDIHMWIDDARCHNGMNREALLKVIKGAFQPLQYANRKEK